MISQEKIRKYVFSNEYRKYYDSYSEYLTITLKMKESTKEWRLKHIRGFLAYLNNQNISITKLVQENIYNYMFSIDNLSDRTKEHRAECIRFFINYLFNINVLLFDGNSILPKIKCHKKTSIISYYTDDEIKSMINAIDINAQDGKRDLAIMLLFANLGLRLTDVQNLKLDNINWSENKLCFIQSKTGLPNSLPLVEELRYALLDYMKNERPKSNLDYVFLKDENNIYNHHKFYDIVEKYINKANININNRKRGPHAIRHSLASSLINSGVPLVKIADILGHQNIEESMFYTHINIVELKKMSLEVPSWKN